MSKFELGQIVITPGAMEAIDHGQIAGMLARHVLGDWGEVDPADWMVNDDAVECGNRILSAYAIDDTKPCKGWGDNCIWIITEWDRSVTTILLPEEY